MSFVLDKHLQVRVECDCPRITGTICKSLSIEFTSNHSQCFHLRREWWWRGRWWKSKMVGLSSRKWTIIRASLNCGRWSLVNDIEFLFGKDAIKWLVWAIHSATSIELSFAILQWLNSSAVNQQLHLDVHVIHGSPRSKDKTSGLQDCQKYNKNLPYFVAWGSTDSTTIVLTKSKYHIARPLLS